MSRYSDKALAALRAMRIDPDRTARVVIDMRANGEVFVHLTAAQFTTDGDRQDQAADLLDAVAEMSPHILPIATLEVREPTNAEVEAAAVRAYEAMGRRSELTAGMFTWDRADITEQDEWRTVIRAALTPKAPA